MAYTVQQLITQAYATAGLIQQGGEPTTAQLNEALVYFNTMLHNWTGFGFDTFARTSLQITLEAGQGTYTIGPMTAGYATPDVITPRPLRILQGYRSRDGIDIPLNEYSKQEWYYLSNKTASGSPTQYYCDQESPISNFYVWPVPDSTWTSVESPMTITIDVMLPYADTAGLSDVSEMPLHWGDAIVSNLAVRLCTRYGREVPPSLQDWAFTSLQLAKGQEYEEADIYRQPDWRY